MAFSRAQQIKYRILVNQAWLAHCDRELITDSTAASKDAWYREQLRRELKIESSTKLNKKDGFERAMALFEDLADAGVYWQMRALQGDARRARHKLDETIQTLRLTEDYVSRVALQAGFREGLKSYTAEQLLKLRIMLLYPVRRRQDRYLQRPIEEGAPAIE